MALIPEGSHNYLNCFFQCPMPLHCTVLKNPLHLSLVLIPRPRYARRLFENGIFILKTHQMFAVNTKREEFRTQQSPVILDTSIFMFEENSAGEITLLPGHHRFLKRSVFKMVSIHTKTKIKNSANSCSLKSIFEKLHFHDGLVFMVLSSCKV